MARKQSAAATIPVSRKFAGRKFAILGKLDYYSAPQHLPPLIQAMGGLLVTKLSADLDFLVLGRGTAKQKAAAEKLNKKRATIRILAEGDLYDLCEPTREEVRAMLRGGKGELACWEALCRVNRIKKPSLRGEDLSDLVAPKGAHLELGDLNLDNANFAGGKLDRASLPRMRGACLDGLSLQSGFLEDLESCTARQADFSRMEVTNSEWKKSDFTEATFVAAQLESVWAEGCQFHGADFSQAQVKECSFSGADLSETTWKNAKLESVDFSEAKLSKASFVDCELAGAKLRKADLRGADLRGANLDGADLTGANVIGADFRGASLAGTNLDNVAIDKAKGINAGQLPARPGKKVAELERIAKKARWLRIAVELADGEIIRKLDIGKLSSGEYSAFVEPSRKKGEDHFSLRTQNLHGAFSAVVAHYPGELRLGTLEVKCEKAPLRAKELRQLAVEACCEAYGVEPPSAEDVEAATLAAKDAVQARFDRWFARLRTDPKSVAKWNKEVTDDARRAATWKRIELAGANLTKVNFDWLRLEDSTLAGANLTEARLGWTRFRQVDFSGAKLDRIDAAVSAFKECNFSGASLRKADLSSIDLTKSNLSRADLTGANLFEADLRGCDLTSAKLDGVEFGVTKFDENTRLPEGFHDFKGLEWKGKGTHPGLLARKSAATATAQKSPRGKLDFSGLMKKLQASLDPSRLDKALAMLKADTFKLFAEVTPDHVIGVVKSQTDSDLVYSCRLGSNGVFACCTQNLNVCGGLRGAVCKHLLVLLVGLAKAGQLDAAAAHAWIAASASQKPILDKDVMSETFVRYKGAEAGDVDWRPTETVPEDYYAL